MEPEDQTPKPNVQVWAARSLDRVYRWKERIRGIVDEATGDVPDHVREQIEDFTAATLRETADIFEKGKTQLAEAHKGNGESKDDAERMGRGFVNEWLEDKTFMRGMLAVRHLDVHVEARYSGRILQLSTAVPGGVVDEWWTHPAIPPDQHELLWPKSQLSAEELPEFNQYLHDTDLRNVLDRSHEQVTDFNGALSQELTRLHTEQGSSGRV